MTPLQVTVAAHICIEVPQQNRVPGQSTTAQDLRHSFELGPATRRLHASPNPSPGARVGPWLRHTRGEVTVLALLFIGSLDLLLVCPVTLDHFALGDPQRHKAPNNMAPGIICALKLPHHGKAAVQGEGNSLWVRKPHGFNYTAYCSLYLWAVC